MNYWLVIEREGFRLHWVHQDAINRHAWPTLVMFDKSTATWLVKFLMIYCIPFYEILASNWVTRRKNNSAASYMKIPLTMYMENPNYLNREATRRRWSGATTSRSGKVHSGKPSLLGIMGNNLGKHPAYCSILVSHKHACEISLNVFLLVAGPC